MLKKIQVNLQRNSLYYIVFFTGAGVLIIEVIATRILAPYFGSTVYSVSSILGIILAALSFGYYYGGILADKNPSRKNFYIIIAAAGISVLFLQLINLTFLSMHARQFSIRSGPVFFSFILFFLPALLLGMLSPYAIKLQKDKNKKVGIGRVSGSIYFSSTVGSIFGSFLAGFYLIPNFGVNNIMVVIGIALTFLGIVGYFLNTGNRVNLLKIFSLLGSLILINLLLTKDVESKFVYLHDGVYQRIAIFDGVYENQNVRFLIQDANASAAKKMNSDDLIFEYTRYFEIYKYFNPEIENALFIGGGAYSAPYALVNDNQDVKVEVVEIEPELFTIVKKHFDYTDHPRLINHVEDGRIFLQITEKKYDLIFSDVYSDLYSIPIHFTTKEFFNLSYESLNENGIMIINLITTIDTSDNSLLAAELKTFKEVFPNYYLFKVQNRENTEPQNLILVGYKSDVKVDFEGKTINDGNIDLGSRIIEVSQTDLEKALVLTDNYAPVESMMMDVLQDF